MAGVVDDDGDVGGDKRSASKGRKCMSDGNCGTIQSARSERRLTNCLPSPDLDDPIYNSSNCYESRTGVGLTLVPG